MKSGGAWKNWVIGILVVAIVVGSVLYFQQKDVRTSPRSECIDAIYNSDPYYQRAVGDNEVKNAEDDEALEQAQEKVDEAQSQIMEALAQCDELEDYDVAEIDQVTCWDGSTVNFIDECTPEPPAEEPTE